MQFGSLSLGGEEITAPDARYVAVFPASHACAKDSRKDPAGALRAAPIPRHACTRACLLRQY
ncbi:hypothetical protein EXIGLDRAFT_726894, partial [Exidia glandulosa HHB12029]